MTEMACKLAISNDQDLRPLKAHCDCQTLWFRLAIYDRLRPHSCRYGTKALVLQSGISDR